MKDFPNRAKRNAKENKDKSKMQVKDNCNWRRKVKRKTKVNKMKLKKHKRFKKVLKESRLRKFNSIKKSYKV